ncbi:MAG TPA: hypothetical protein VIJ66_07225 [Solirubrobacteraceae bacterium]
MRVLVGALAVLVVAAPASARPVIEATASRYQRVYVANKDCRGHTFRPEKIILACGDGNLYVTEVHFFKGTSEVYGSPQADAHTRDRKDHRSPAEGSIEGLSRSGSCAVRVPRR